MTLPVISYVPTTKKSLERETSNFYHMKKFMIFNVMLDDLLAI